MAAVKSYRRAMGLCYKCAGKWSKDSKCPPEILLVVADLWDFDELPKSPPLSPEDEQVSGQIYQALSKAATSGALVVHTI